MFKLSIITDEISQDFERALDVALDMGLDCVELRTMWDQNIVNLEWDDVQRVKRMLKARGLTVSCLASPFLKCFLPHGRTITKKGDSFKARGETYEEHMKILARSIELAREFETDLVRCFSFWRVENPDEVWDEIVELFQEPLRIAEREGITLALENEHACNVATGAETHRLLQSLASDYLRVIWDPCNALFGGEVPYPDGYELVKDRVVHVHVKDARRVPGAEKPELMPVGQGDIDWHGQIKALIRDGYRGALSLETHWHPPTMSREASSRECFAGLRRIIDSLGAG